MMAPAPVITAIALAVAVAAAGCDSLPGKPRPAGSDRLPSQVMAFSVLYRENCAACHGADGRLGASRPLNDPLYLAVVPRSRLRQVIANGVPGTLQPAFAQSAGGTLTAGDPEKSRDAMESHMNQTEADLRRYVLDADQRSPTASSQLEKTK